MTPRDAIEVLALEVLRRAGIMRPPVDIDAVAAAEGLRFVPLGFDSLLGAYCADPPSHELHKGPFAMIGSHQHPLRQRFTKAHELAHHLMDEPRGWVVRMQLPLAQRYNGVDYHEAHELFAASLLLPRPWVERFDGGSWRRKDVARLAEHFAVTKIAAAVRLEEVYGRPPLEFLGLTESDRYARA